jgi:hypothetical protein
VLNGTPSLFSLTGGIRTLDGLQNQVPKPKAWRDLLHYFHSIIAKILPVVDFDDPIIFAVRS